MEVPERQGVRYRRVSTTDEEPDEDKKRRRAEAVDRVSTKIQAFFWVALTAVVIYFTDFIRVVLESEKVDRLYLNIAFACLAINTCLTFYLTIWLPYVQRVTLSWEVYCPRVIPTATVVGLLCFVCAMKGLWAVYGFLTPLILLVMFMGFLFSTHFIPFPC